MINIVLGTANFGQLYGLNQQLLTGKSASPIIVEAKQCEIHNVDTASLYGESERVLAGCLTEDFKVSTKVYFDANSSKSAFDQLFGQFSHSYSLLGSKITCVKFHNFSQAIVADKYGVMDFIENISGNYAKVKVGCSIYSPDEMKLILHWFTPNIIQAPLNIFDRRIVDSGWAKTLNEMGIELEVRSLFLQGLLASPILFQKVNLDQKYREQIKKFFEICAQARITPIEAAFALLNSIKNIDRAVFGVSSALELRCLSESKHTQNSNMEIFDQFITNDLKLIDPREWT